jgi:hypothetical protein
MKNHIFEVVVNCENLDQAETVMAERIGYDECLGFDYSIKLNDTEPVTLTKSFQMINKMSDVLTWLIDEYESGELSNAPDGLITAARQALDSTNEVFQ